MLRDPAQSQAITAKPMTNAMTVATIIWTGVMPPLAMSGMVKRPAATTAGIASRNE